MPLFPRFVPHTSQQSYCHPKQAPSMDLNTLLSLLGGDQANPTSYHHQSPARSSPATASHSRGNAQARAFSPSFDVIETPDAYILEGELPGLSDKRAVDIEFTDHQTLLVKGNIEKTTTTTSAAPSGEGQQQQEEEAPRPKSPPRPTVEDELDEDEDGKSTVFTPASTVVSNPEEKKEQQQKKDQVRYWVSERTIGSFQRTFSFPGLIDQDSVTAKLKNGILTIVVPKRQKQPTRRIEIQ